MIDNGADERSILFKAVRIGNADIVKILLSRGGNVNIKTKDGMTPLMSASHNGNTKIVKLLINNGADLDEKNEKLYTALMYAAESGHKEIVELLVNSGADISIRKILSNAEMLARAKGHIAIENLLKGKREINRSNSTKNTYIEKRNEDKAQFHSNVELLSKRYGVDEFIVNGIVKQYQRDAISQSAEYFENIKLDEPLAFKSILGAVGSILNVGSTNGIDWSEIEKRVAQHKKQLPTKKMTDEEKFLNREKRREEILQRAKKAGENKSQEEKDRLLSEAYLLITKLK